MEELLERIKNTKKSLRKQEILHEFNNHNQHFDVEKQKEKFIKMTKSPYQFFLGSSYLFYNDISKISVPYQTVCWIHGNLNVNSFRIFKDEEGNAVFDVNHFHDGFKGSYFYDLLRMSVSILLYGDSLNLSKKEQKETIYQFLKGYYKQLKNFKKRKVDSSIVFTKKNTDGPVKKYLKRFEKSEEEILNKVTVINENNERVFILSDSLIELEEAEKETIFTALEQYFSSVEGEQLKVKDIVRKVNHDDIPSFGLDSYYILIEQEDNEEFVLVANEVCAPVPAYYLPINEWKQYEHEGERVVTIEKTVRNLEDPYLGYVTINEKHFYIQKLKYLKDLEISKAKKVQKVAKIMGKVTAKIHCSEDEKISGDILNEMVDLDEFYKQIMLIALPYKKRVYKDYKIYNKWIDDEYFDNDEGSHSDENTVVPTQYPDEVNVEQLTEEVEIVDEQIQENNAKPLNKESLESERKEQLENVEVVPVVEINEPINIESTSSEEKNAEGTLDSALVSSSLNEEVGEVKQESNSEVATSDEEIVEEAENSNIVSISSELENVEVELEEPKVEEEQENEATDILEIDDSQSEVTDVTEEVEQTTIERITLEEKDEVTEEPVQEVSQNIDHVAVEQNDESEISTRVENETVQEESVHDTVQQTTVDSENETTDAEIESEEEKTAQQQANVEISASIVEENEATEIEKEENVKVNPEGNHSKNETQQNKQNYQMKNRNSSPRSKGNRRPENKPRANQNSKNPTEK